MKTILVIGSKGFIAKHYCNTIRNKFRLIEYDLPNNILDFNRLEKDIKNIDLVIHFAAIADLNVCLLELDKTFDVNIKGTYFIARLCSQYNKGLIFISTCCVYGNTPDRMAVEDETAPQATEPYACSKVAGEYILRGMPGLKYVILRIGTVYGPGMREALFTYVVLDAIKNNKKIFIDGNGAQIRQLVYIGDLIEGIVKTSLQFDELPDRCILNLCGRVKISALETMQTAEHVLNAKAVWEYRVQRYGQIFNENISVAKAAKLLGWKPATTFYNGMKYTFENDIRFSNPGAIHETGSQKRDL